MPTYTYGCRNCQKTFDVFKSVRDCETEEICPCCQSSNTAKHINAVPIVYKGTGFYTTDYKAGK